jgi:flagellar hook-basal body complex protein FliE
MPIVPTSLAATLPLELPASGAPTADAASGFQSALARIVNSVESSTSDANTAVAQMLEGKGDVHDAMIALQRAEMNFELTVQMRNKLVQAYQDIMRMPV